MNKLHIMQYIPKISTKVKVQMHYMILTHPTEGSDNIWFKC